MKKFKKPTPETSAEVIQFDPHDLKGMCNIMDKYQDLETMVIGENELGEVVTFSVYQDHIITETYQDNHWVRRNTFWRDGTREETFTGKWD